MVELYNSFCVYLKNKKKASDNTLASYQRDIKCFISFVQSKKISDANQIDSNIIDSYIKKLKKAGKSDATVSRALSSLRCFFKYLVYKKVIDFNPMVGIKSETKKNSSLPEVMSANDVNALLNSPDCSSIKGKRDKAMLEVLYATGMRVSELLSIKVTDVNLDVGYILVNKGTDKERVLPLYPIAVNALSDYMKNAKDKFAVNDETDALFLNSAGGNMTRQGFWKIIKHYASVAKIDADITPKTLRHSFATHLLENGADIHIIKDMLGHTALSSTMIYTKVLKNKYLGVYENCHPRAKI